jgi:hypothetical protein
MRRLAIAMTALTAAMGATAAIPAVSAADDPAYAKYAQLRDDLYQCDVDTNWGQLSSQSRDDCQPLFRDYVLFTQNSASYTMYIHCRSSARCIATPEGYPKASDPIPSDSTVYDVQPRSTPSKAPSKPKSAGHHRHHRHRHHAS